MSILRMMKVTREINEADRLERRVKVSLEDRPVILPEGMTITPGPLPVEAQVLLRVMGEDLSTAKELIKGMRPVDRAILSFYLTEGQYLINEVNESEGRY